MGCLYQKGKFSTQFRWLAPALLMVVVVTAQNDWAPEYGGNQNILLRYLRAQSQPLKYVECSFPMTSCIPGNRECCAGLKCRNKFGHVCLYPLENCFCTD